MNITGEYITRSDEETFELGERIGEALTERIIFLLHGDLGAGKTVFSKGVAAGLGIDPRDVTSPTFTLINEYEGRLRLFHVDLYRLEEGATTGLGLEEIFEKLRAVVLVEWAERLGYVPTAAMQVNIEYLDEETRRIVINN
jgi:tRNA threonylcarbamoyladenosine biosynthesis protein TsaE